MIKLLPAERGDITKFIYSACAISLDPSKDYLIENRLNGLMNEIGCKSFTELLGRASADASGAIKRRIVDQITTNETQFFRDSGPFDLLRYKVLPEILLRYKDKSVKPTIRIWSAACSTGQELYSTAITIREAIDNYARCNIRLLGTDISDNAVSRASKGLFSKIEIDRGLPQITREKYFMERPNGWQVVDELRAMVSFRRLNLMEDFSSLGKFDVIFCRNVAIYFNDQDRTSLFNRLEKSLEDDGHLIIGSMESIKEICPQFKSKQYQRTIYYQREQSKPALT